MDPSGCPPDDERSRERVRYFFGMLVGIDEFIQEQAYFRAKACRHNRLLHGWGVVSGLEVSPVGLDGTQVSVTPGYAIDPGGNEISVDAPVVIDVATDGILILAARFDEELVAEGRARDGFVIDLVCEAGEPWVDLAAITVTDGQVVALDPTIRRPLSLD